MVESVGLDEGAAALLEYIGVDGPNLGELGYCSNSRTVSNVARSLDWKPIRGPEARGQGF